MENGSDRRSPGGRPQGLFPFSRDKGFLTLALLLLLVAVWLEPAGSWLAEPDEARYAEIPREMLAAGDFVTPRLNGVPYLEKPPLLYWANALSIHLFGETPWAARLPTRLAALGTILTLVLGVAAAWGIETGLAAAVLYLASPLGFSLSRINLTDGLLTFFFTSTLFCGREALRRRESGQPSAALSALTGLMTAGAFLTKGLVGVILPGGVLLLWCLATRRLRMLFLLLTLALPVFLLAAMPWFLLAARRHPGFLQFFFIHEHLQRFATPIASREGPVYYFALVFVAGFLPALPFFFSSLKRVQSLARWPYEEPEALFFLLWFSVVLIFFSVSRSKLPPYLLPAFPAAAALAARGLESPARSRSLPWLAQAGLAALLVAGVTTHPIAREWIADYKLLGIALLGGATLLAGTFCAPFLLMRGAAVALGAFAVGWAGFYGALAVAYPRVPTATALHDLSQAAKRAAAEHRATVVGYQTYIQGLPWALKSPVPLADYVGELEPQFEPRAEVRDGLFWSREKFWSEWKSSRRLLAVVRQRDLREFGGAGIPATVLAQGPRHYLLANFPKEER